MAIIEYAPNRSVGGVTTLMSVGQTDGLDGILDDTMAPVKNAALWAAGTYVASKLTKVGPSLLLAIGVFGAKLVLNVFKDT